MTKTQQERIDVLKNEILLSDGLGESHVESYEFKKIEIKEESGLVFLLTVVGSKTDEGTLAALLCRKTRHICIGKRGALCLLNSKKKSHSKGLFWCVNGLTY